MQERPLVPMGHNEEAHSHGTQQPFCNHEERGEKNLAPCLYVGVSESTNPKISSPVTLNNTFSYYFRYSELGFCHLPDENVLLGKTTKNKAGCGGTRL